MRNLQEAKLVLLRIPDTPVGRTDVDPRPGRDILPAHRRLLAREHERVHAIVVDDGQFEVAAGWRACDRIPHSASVIEDSLRALI